MIGEGGGNQARTVNLKRRRIFADEARDLSKDKGVVL